MEVFMRFPGNTELSIEWYGHQSKDYAPTFQDSSTPAYIYEYTKQVPKAEKKTSHQSTLSPRATTEGKKTQEADSN